MLGDVLWWRVVQFLRDLVGGDSPVSSALELVLLLVLGAECALVLFPRILEILGYLFAFALLR